MLLLGAKAFLKAVLSQRISGLKQKPPQMPRQQPMVQILAVQPAKERPKSELKAEENKKMIA